MPSILYIFLSGLASGVTLGLSFFAGKGLVFLGYGRKGCAALKELNNGLPKGASIIWAIVFLIWAIFGVLFYILFRESADAIISLVIMIAGPVIYMLWFICARARVPRLLCELDQVQNLRKAEQAEKDHDKKDLGHLPQRDPQPGDWQCPCGRVNPKYITTCACGTNRNQIIKTL